MKPQLFTQEIAILIALLVLLLGGAACSKTVAPSGKDSNIDYWTCTMQPSVHAKDPGKCPIWSMDLVPVMRRADRPPSPTPAATPTHQPNSKGDEMKGLQGMGD